LATSLSVNHDFAASPAAVYALLTDRAFLQRRLEATGGTDPVVVSLDVAADGATVVTRQAIPERTENWRVDGNGYQADFGVVIKGAPASLKGTMSLTASGTGSTLKVDGQATVPIPLFGGKIESVVAEQVDALLTKENSYTATALAS